MRPIARVGLPFGFWKIKNSYNVVACFAGASVSVVVRPGHGGALPAERSSISRCIPMYGSLSCMVPSLPVFKFSAHIPPLKNVTGKCKHAFMP
jgi:hypothetical protein